MKKIVIVQGAKPKGPYNAAIIASGQFLFIAGQGPVDPMTQEVIGGGFEQQAHRALSNLKQIVEYSGGNLNNAVKVQVFLRNIDTFAQMNSIYSQYFTDQRPVRTTVESGLPLGYEIEIDAIIALD